MGLSKWGLLTVIAVGAMLIITHNPSCGTYNHAFYHEGLCGSRKGLAAYDLAVHGSRFAVWFTVLISSCMSAVYT